MLTGLVASMLLAMAPAALTHQDRCLNGLRPALVRGGFSGSVDCRNDRLWIRHVGQVQKFGRTFEIYANRYRLKPACPECAVHGGQRIIFMERGRYVGQYRLDFVRVAVRSGNLVFEPTDPKSGKLVEVVFTPNGPPAQIWAAGEVNSFFK